MVVYDSSNSLTNHWVEETEVAGPDGNNGDENSDYEPIVLHPPYILTANITKVH